MRRDVHVDPRELELRYGIRLAPFTSLCDRCRNLLLKGHPYVIVDGLWQHHSCPPRTDYR